MKTLLAAKCRICNQQLGLHQQDTLKCPAYRDGFPAGYGDTVYEPKFFTAADLADAEEKGRREGWKRAVEAMEQVQKEYVRRFMTQDPAEWEMFKTRIAEHDALLAEGKKEGKE